MKIPGCAFSRFDKLLKFVKLIAMMNPKDSNVYRKMNNGRTYDPEGVAPSELTSLL